MRFGNYKLNEKRVKKHFAFFPITIKGETRWLEYVEYIVEWYNPFDSGWGWYPQKFIN
jgi:hypothetical protein